eukprot:TRINITY_DN2427_c0_g1_i2.p1 TRINITY_DN2427_c0_g1~~TRINITY_DN2427_c0_g1_i2.p1  ORF type:complete len:1135 (-),score=218.62 TRINITY_DN2427_c0_g1_i2:275-3616(-)
MIPAISTAAAFVSSVAWELRGELLIFVFAFAVHHTVFGCVGVKAMQLKGKARSPDGQVQHPTKSDCDGYTSKRSGDTEGLCPKSSFSDLDGDSLLAASEAAYERGDHKSVLRLWNSLRKTNKVSATHMARVVEGMQRLWKDSAKIVSEVRGYLSRNQALCRLDYVNHLLECLAKSLDVHVVGGIVESMPSLNLAPDAVTYEVLIAMQFSTRSFAAVEALDAEMRARGIEPTQRARLTLLKTAVHHGKLDESLHLFREVSKRALGAEVTASAAPTYLVQQLVELGCKEHRLEDVLDEVELCGRRIESPRVLEVMHAECERLGSSELQARVHRLPWIGMPGDRRGSRSRVSDVDEAKIEELIAEIPAACASGTISEVVTTALLHCRNASTDATMVEQLFDKLCEAGAMTQKSVLSAILQFYIEQMNPQKACDLYETHVMEQLTSTSDPGSSSCIFAAQIARPQLDVRCERALALAALQTNRQDILADLLRCAISDTTRHMGLVRCCATKGDLDTAMAAFSLLDKREAKLTHCSWNVALDACVELKQWDRVDAMIKRMEADAVTDAVSYNTVIKMYLQREDHTKARQIVATMRKAGFAPNVVTYNELLHAYAKNIGRGRDSRAWVWELVDEMRRDGVHPNRVTCSILMRNSKGNDVVRAMELVDSMEEPIDEVLLSSVVEACVRAGKLVLLSQKLKDLHSSGVVKVSGAHTFGSLIKAYGFIKDIDGAWRCWREMVSQHIKPTSITIGCMVEAVAANGDVDGAYELICSLLEDGQTQDQINHIIYGSVLKGYGRLGRIERVMEVFEEMVKKGITPSQTSYNAVIDACARGEQMDRVPKLISDMKARGLQPNIITYSTVIKGYAMRGDMSLAIETLNQLRKEREIQADEILYNTILDGCGLAGLVDEGERLFQEMLEEGLEPSNYTLTSMVRMLGGGRRITRAFEVVDLCAKRYRLRPNGHVYTALILACVGAKDVARAASTYEQSVRERAMPDVKACQTLIRALLSSGNHVKAVALLRNMLGLSGGTSGEGGISLNDNFLNDVLTILRAVGPEGCSLASVLSADLKALPQKDVAASRGSYAGKTNGVATGGANNGTWRNAQPVALRRTRRIASDEY